MKTIPPSCPEPDSGPKYWRSLEEQADSPEFRALLEREFPAGASELTDPVTRRSFVKLMSASFLLAGVGLTGCRRPEEKILPFGKMPEGYVHGVPRYFATSMPTRGSAVPLIAKSHEGRPTKVEGNAEHPLNLVGGQKHGGTDLHTQASVLNLYDVDRSQRFLKGGASTKRETAFEALADVAKQAQAGGGQGLAFLSGRGSSPSRTRVQKLVSAKFPNAKWFIHEAVDFDIQREAATAAFGKPVTPRYQLDQAKVIVTLDCDFAGTEEDSYLNIRRFAHGRKMGKSTDGMSRLYSIESLFTLTGLNADHRLRVASGAIAGLAAKLAAQILPNGPVSQSLSTLSAAAGALNDKWIEECAKDLRAQNGQAIVLAGHRQPLEVHLLAQAINAALGAVGKTVVFHDAPAPTEGTISQLAQALNAGQVSTLVILGGNPAYTAPAELAWTATQRKAKQVIRLGYYEDETTQGVDWHLPLAHYLESWGDARTTDGTLVPVQPLIEPLFGGITELEVLARIGGLDKTSAYEIVRETFSAVGGSVEDNWEKFLHDGFLAGSAASAVSVSLAAGAVASAVRAAKPLPVPTKDQLEVVFHRDLSVDDGRFNNNGWLQELPDPVSKIVWENVILLSPQTAKDLGLVIIDKENNNLQVPVVKIDVGGRSVEGPAWIQPGQADNVVGLALGYGRQQTGRVGKGTGYNAYSVRASAALHAAGGAKLTSVGRLHPLATTQNHWAMEGRPIIREANFEQYQKQPNFASAMNMHEPPGPRDAQGRPQVLYPNPLDVAGADGKSPRERATHAWGMSIDLNSCVGCSSCMMACQSENNIPIVGKNQVRRNREMHWIRLDRYYAGDINNPQAVVQPMLCQHCEAAPCESVCPVNATVHDEEGLNVMAYNRCVGTRYCSNNCPYKVRRFNYFDYNRRPLSELAGPVYSTPVFHSTEGEWDIIRWLKNPDKGMRPDDEWELTKLAKNPDVTVRMRGIMEKCSFCIQRIEQSKIKQKVKAGASGDVEVPDGTIQTACQQACPADAIVFGNVKDPNSRVSKLKAQDRDYTVLEFLATKPRTTYLARVRNPNPAMPDYHKQPLTLEDWEAKGNSLEGHHGDHAKPGEAHDAGAAHGEAAGHGAEKKGAH